MNWTVIKRILLYLVILVLFISCSQSCDDPYIQPESISDNQYSIYLLDYADLYYNYPLSFWQVVDPFNYVCDEDSVIISEYKGEWYYNPVTLSLRGLTFIDRFVNMHDSLHLKLAFRHRDALIDLMDENYLLEYRMDYNHKDIYFKDPWYSGMAQGLALSMLSRMAGLFEDSTSIELSHHLFETLNPFSELSHEVVDVDSGAYAWIEEYPDKPADRTFNGFMHAIIGVYDYYHFVNSNDFTRHDPLAYFHPSGRNPYCQQMSRSE